MEKLDLIPPALRHAFINNQDPLYLHQIEYQGINYLGKFLNPPIEMSNLDTIQYNLESLLKKLIPNLSFDELPPLTLLAICNPTNPTS